MEEKKILIIWDFDWSLIDENSDPYIVTKLGDSTILEELKNNTNLGLVWTHIMDVAMQRLHEMGVRKEQLESVFAEIPFRESALKILELCSPVCDMIIVSNANEFFIDTILTSYKAKKYFPNENIYTHPAKFDDNGRLNISAYHPVDFHSCANRCPSYMCKEPILNKYETVIYVGDSEGDFCPCTKMKETDFVLARKDLSLEKRLSKEVHLIKAKVLSWNSYDEMLELFTSIVLKKSQQQ